MGFRENLKSEMDFCDISNKELAYLSAVNIATLNSYLNVRGRMPSAENAVKIARALGCTVEYLVTGEDVNVERPVRLSRGTRILAQNIEKLSYKNKKMLAELVQSLKEAETN